MMFAYLFNSESRLISQSNRHRVASRCVSGAVFLLVILLTNFAVVTAADVNPSSSSADTISPQTHQTHPTTASVYAEVNGEKISIQEFQSAFQAGMRKRFYHGKIPRDELRKFRQEVSQTLIDRVLLVEEARRLNLSADHEKVAMQLKEYEKRYADKPFWKNNRELVLPGLRKALEGESLLRALEAQVRNVELPNDAQTQRFYEKNPELFTTPEKVRVSLILLKVSPASPANVWQAAQQEADQIIKRIQKGMDFADLARIHSGDASANNGGDMGFIHQGMLAEPAQKAVDKMTVGQISQAVMTLRGIAIFRLEEKQNARLNDFSSVKDRAKKLLQRENSKLAWRSTLEALRASADVKLNDAILAVNK